MIAKKGRGALVTCDHSYFFICFSAGIWGTEGEQRGTQGTRCLRHRSPARPRLGNFRAFLGVFLFSSAKTS